MLKIILAVLLMASSAAYAGLDPYTDYRYCGEPKRNKDNTIKRSNAVREAFERIYPLPPGNKRSEWQLDHVLPLSEGGCDAVFNMQWLPISIKTCSDDKCKDRFERIIYPAKRNEKKSAK